MEVISWLDTLFCSQKGGSKDACTEILSVAQKGHFSPVRPIHSPKLFNPCSCALIPNSGEKPISTLPDCFAKFSCVAQWLRGFWRQDDWQGSWMMFRLMLASFNINSKTAKTHRDALQVCEIIAIATNWCNPQPTSMLIQVFFPLALVILSETGSDTLLDFWIFSHSIKRSH